VAQIVAAGLWLTVPLESGLLYYTHRTIDKPGDSDDRAWTSGYKRMDAAWADSMASHAFCPKVAVRRAS
jgi:hypothetical protein